ncbi:MAG: class I SAM-dependent methyltransferase [Rhodospirillales bacterium]
MLDELALQMPFLHRATCDAKSVPIAQRLSALQSIGERLSQIYDGDDWIRESVRSYVYLSLEFLRLQRELEKTGAYLMSTEAETAQHVYDNADVFGGYYLPGLLLTEALWPNHFVLNTAFLNRFVEGLPPNPAILEVGVGTGYHLSQLLDRRESARYVGLDISEYAIDFCRRYAGVDHASSSSATFRLESITGDCALPEKSFDGIVIGEVLEHIETPFDVMVDLRRAAKPGATLFMTTVAFAANIDHIYMFESVEEIRDLVQQSGWTIEADWPLPVYPQDTPDMARRPMNYGAVLKN